jgi:hypothetical protein
MRTVMSTVMSIVVQSDGEHSKYSDEYSDACAAKQSRARVNCPNMVSGLNDKLQPIESNSHGTAVRGRS